MEGKIYLVEKKYLQDRIKKGNKRRNYDQNYVIRRLQRRMKEQEKLIFDIVARKCHGKKKRYCFYEYLNVESFIIFLFLLN